MQLYTIPTCCLSWMLLFCGPGEVLGWTSPRQSVRQKTRLFSLSPHHQEQPLDPNDEQSFFFHNNVRRQVLSAPLLLSLFGSATPANARGLMQFPLTAPLANRYHFLRTGMTLLEAQDMWSTNPLFMTNREDALSETGHDQVRAACQQLKHAAPQQQPTLAFYSLAAASVDTASWIQRELGLGRNNILVEYTYLDPRGIGQWDMTAKEKNLPALWALDVDQAGVDGTGGRPPAHTDGTPHETLADHAIRLRQLLSGMETRYSGETILLVFPDGGGPALLSAMMAGIPYSESHELELGPGELRMDVTKESVLELLQKRRADSKMHGAYEEKVAQGRIRLQELLQHQDDDDNVVVSLMDQKMEQERLEIDQAYQKQQEQVQRQERQERKDLLERQRVVASQYEDRVISPTLLGVAGVAAVPGGVIALASDPKNQAVAVPVDNDTESLSATNATSGFESLQSDHGDASSSLLQPAVAGVPAHLEVNLYATLTQNDTVSSTAIPAVDRLEAAQRAMQDYLDQDDGGNAWLQSMSEIAQDGGDEDTAFD